MRRVRLVLLAGLAVAFGVAALQPGEVAAQSGAAVAETGWWSKQPSGTPGTAFEVATAPDGDVSVAAIRIRVDGEITSAQLQLAELQVAGTPSLQVCATTAPWTAGGPGNWDDRPEPACGSTPVLLARNEVQRLWTVDIRSFLAAGLPSVSVMVVPAPAEGITVPPPTPAPPLPLPSPPATLPPPSTVPAQSPVPLPFTIGFSGAELLAEGVASNGGAPTGDLGFSPSVEPAGELGTDDSLFAAPDISSSAEQAVAAPAQVAGRFPQRGDVGAPGGDGAHQPWGRAPFLALAAAAIGAATGVGRQRLRDLGWLGA